MAGQQGPAAEHGGRNALQSATPVCPAWPVFLLSVTCPPLGALGLSTPALGF